MGEAVREGGLWRWWLVLLGALPLCVGLFLLLAAGLPHAGAGGLGGLLLENGPWVLLLLALLGAVLGALHRLVRGYLGDLAVSFLWGALGVLGLLVAGAVLLR